MQKTTTWEFLVLTALHLLFGYATVAMGTRHAALYEDLLMGRGFPACTVFALSCGAWPYVISIVSAAGVLCSIKSWIGNEILSVAAFTLACASSLLMMITASGHFIVLFSVVQQ